MGGLRRAFLDASVLYPVSLRNLLMRLTLTGLYQARWSAHVHDEWIRSVLRDHPHIPPARLQDLRAAMDERAEENGRKPIACLAAAQIDRCHWRLTRHKPIEKCEFGREHYGITG
jgi:hypothetical protein